MTRKEKADRIRNWCFDKRMGECRDCVLFDFPEDGCFENCVSDETIDRNYEVLFGKTEEDPVNKASHYNDGAIECIDALEASMSPVEYVGFLKGQVLKYIWRYRLKGKPVEDLKKARYYLDRLIRIVENGEARFNEVCQG